MLCHVCVCVFVRVKTRNHKMSGKRFVERWYLYTCIVSLPPIHLKIARILSLEQVTFEVNVCTLKYMTQNTRG